MGGTTFAYLQIGCRVVNTAVVMKMIQPNCRVQFAAEDIDFIVSVLGRKLGTAECLVKLLADEEERDLILDDEALFHALLERRGCLRVSSRFYFYILVRHVFRRSDIQDRAVADYVAEVLAEFSRAERARCVVPGRANPLDYFFEMLAALQTADDRTSFFIRRAYRQLFALSVRRVSGADPVPRGGAGFSGCEILRGAGPDAISRGQRPSAGAPVRAVRSSSARWPSGLKPRAWR